MLQNILSFTIEVLDIILIYFNVHYFIIHILVSALTTL